MSVLITAIAILLIAANYFRWFKKEGHRFSYSATDLISVVVLLSLVALLTIKATPLFQKATQSHYDYERPFLQGCVVMIWVGTISGLLMGRCFAISIHSGNSSLVSIMLGAVIGNILSLMAFVLVFGLCALFHIRPLVF